MRIALFQPDIAGNVGTIMRLCACMGIPLDLIEPMGFPWGERALRRAGMDYADTARVTRHADWDTFLTATPGRIILATTRGADRLDAARFLPGDVLLFGKESAGAPDYVHAAAAARVVVPLRPDARSLNLSVTAGIALWEGLRQTGGVGQF